MGRQTRLLTALTIGATGAITMPTIASAAPAGPHGGAWRPAVTPITTATIHRSTVTVKAGDFLSAIAAAVDRTWPQLAGYNHLANPNLILPGQVLSIPPKDYVPPVAVHLQPSTYVPTHYASYSAGGFEACVLARESGGNPNARNGQYWGAYQFSESRWVAAGGSASSYGSAGFAEQQQVFHQAMADGMSSAWAPYDGC